MAKLEVLTFPNPILKKKALPVKKITNALIELANDMVETMYEAPGVGLAANQIGVLERLVVIDTSSRGEDGNFSSKMTDLEKELQYPLIFFNPEIIEKAGQTTYDEGCLSVPGYVENVSRSQMIQIKYMNKKGEIVELKTDGLLAICIQHEIDHLDGRLFIDRLSPIRRNLIKARIKKHGYTPSAESEKSAL